MLPLPRLRLLIPVSTADGDDGDAETHDGPVDKAKLARPVDKAKLATVPTTLLGSTGRNPEKRRVVKPAFPNRKMAAPRFL